MPEPGIYMINSTGETAALATEGGNGDRQLLHEALDRLGIQHPPKQYECDVCERTFEEKSATCPACSIGHLQERDQ